MFNNGSFLNRALTNGNYGCHSNLIRYLTPCEILKEYLIDPCSIFNGTIIPTGSMPPPQPLPPLPIPPIPPFPPGPIGSRAQFIAPVRQMMRPDHYVFDTILIEGPNIQHVDGTSEIILAPNKIYEIAWVTESLFGVDMNFRSGSVLQINNADIRGTVSTTTGNGLTPIIAQGNIRYQTLPGEGVLTLENISVPNLPNDSEATLTITEIL